MLELNQEMKEVGHVPVRRLTCFAAALALKQNNPQMALELINPIQNQNFFLVRSIKVSGMIIIILSNREFCSLTHDLHFRF